MIGWSLAPTAFPPFRDVGRCKISDSFAPGSRPLEEWCPAIPWPLGVQMSLLFGGRTFFTTGKWWNDCRLRLRPSFRPPNFRNQESSLDTGCCHGGDTNMDISLVILGMGKQRGDLSLAMASIAMLLEADGRMMYHGLCTILHKNNNPLFALNNYTTLCIHNFPNITQS